MHSIPHSPSKRLLCFSAGIVALFCLSSPKLTAQQSVSQSAQTSSASDLENKRVDLVFENQSLTSILRTLSERIGRGIILDGKPLVSEGTLQLHTTAKKALDQVAETFDCTWDLGKHGAVLMNKRFHQPGDLPQLHLKEMQKMAADLLTIWPENAGKARLSRYPFVTPQISPGNALFRTFTDEQVTILKSGNQIIFQDLSDTQKDLVRLGILNGASGTSHDIWEGLNARLEKMPYSYLQWRSWFHNQLDSHPTPYQFSLEYIWPDLQDRGYDRLLPATMVLNVPGEQAK
jgi:hypothetical protein